MGWLRSCRGRLGLIGVLVLVAGSAAAQAPWRLRSAPPQEYRETYRDWTVSCQVWSAPRRVECELKTAVATGDAGEAARVVWLRSSQRWLDGIRFRLDEAAVDVGRGVRLWVDNALFLPEFACTPFGFEANSCAVHDPEVNQRLVERFITAQRVSAVGVSPRDGRKAEVRFSLSGFRAALERTEQLRSEAGTPWM